MSVHPVRAFLFALVVSLLSFRLGPVRAEDPPAAPPQGAAAKAADLRARANAALQAGDAWTGTDLAVEALGFLERALGSAHPEVARLQRNIAVAFTVAARWPEPRQNPPSPEDMERIKLFDPRRAAAAQDRAAAFFALALETYGKAHGADHAMCVEVLSTWAQMESNRHRRLRASDLARQAADMAERLHGPDAEPVGRLRWTQGQYLMRLGDRRGVVAPYEQAVRILGRQLDPNSPDRARLLVALGSARAQAGQDDAARVDLEAALSILDGLGGAARETAVDAASVLSQIEYRAGNLRRAVEMRDRVTDYYVRRDQAEGRTRPEPDPAARRALLALIEDLEAPGTPERVARLKELARENMNLRDQDERLKFRELFAILKRLFALRREQGAAPDVQEVELLTWRGRYWLDRGEPGLAEADFVRALEILAAVAPADAWGRAGMHNRLGLAACHRRDYARAREAYEQAYVLASKSAQRDSDDVTVLHVAVLARAALDAFLLGPDSPLLSLELAVESTRDLLKLGSSPESVELRELSEVCTEAGRTDLVQRLREAAPGPWSRAEGAAAKREKVAEDLAHARSEGRADDMLSALRALVDLTPDRARPNDPWSPRLRARLDLGLELARRREDAEARAILEGVVYTLEAGQATDLQPGGFIAQALEALARLDLAIGNLEAARGRAARARDLLLEGSWLDLKAMGVPEDPVFVSPLVQLKLRSSVVGDSRAQVGPDLVLARVHGARGADDEALAVLEPALGRLEAVAGPNDVRLAEPLLLIARSRLALGQYAPARQALERAANLRGLGAEDLAQAEVLVVRGDLELAEGHAQRARDDYEAALRLVVAKRSLDLARQSDLLGRVGRAARASGDATGAERSLEQALETATRALAPRGASLSLEDRLRLQGVVRTALDAYLEPSSDPGRTYGAVLRFKGLVVRGVAAERRLESALSPEARAAATELAKARARLARLSQDVPGGRMRRLKWVEQNAAASAEVARRGEALAVLVAKSVVVPVEISLADLRARLAPQAAWIDFVRHGARYSAFVVPRTGPVARVDLGDAAPLDAAVEMLRREIADGADVAASLGEVARRLWVPVSTLLPPDVRTLYLVPDGALATVPFAALPVDPEGTPLLERHTLCLLGHPQDLVASKRAERAPMLAVVGAVDYAQASGPSDTAAGAESGDALALAAVGGMRAPSSLKRFRPLTETGAEAEAVAAAHAVRWPGAPLVRLQGQDATEERVREAAGQARWLHLATHGFVRADLPSVLDLPRAVGASVDVALLGQAVGYDPLLLSGLALAGANPRAGGGDDDGILTAFEAMDLPLVGTDLIVLSACDTAGGSARSGEGVLGLVRALRWAGAGEVVASLWPVDDLATRTLMEGFYAALWKKIRAPDAAEALREAALALRAQPGTKGQAGPFTHPRHWAAFVVLR